MKFCPSCGAEITANSKFCKACGANLEGTQEAAGWGKEASALAWCKDPLPWLQGHLRYDLLWSRCSDQDASEMDGPHRSDCSDEVLRQADEGKRTVWHLQAQQHHAAEVQRIKQVKSRHPASSWGEAGLICTLCIVLLDNRLVCTNRCKPEESIFTALDFDNHLTTYVVYFTVFLSVAQSKTCRIWSKVFDATQFLKNAGAVEI